jgi:hypothetical protein
MGVLEMARKRHSEERGFNAINHLAGDAGFITMKIPFGGSEVH